MDMQQMPPGEKAPAMGGDMKAKMQQCMALMEEIMGMMGGEQADPMQAERASVAKEVFGGQ